MGAPRIAPPARAGTRLRVLALMTAVLVGLVAAGLPSSPAHAYPPGLNIKVSTNKVVYPAKTKVRTAANYVKPGCTVRIKIKGTTQSRNVRAGARGVAYANFTAPRRPGVYTVVAVDTCTGKSSTTRIRVR